MTPINTHLVIIRNPGLACGPIQNRSLSRRLLMMKTRLRLLLLAAVLTGTALLSAAPPAEAACPFYCWHVDENTTCCQLRDCSVRC
jgi:hypothetical protein